MRAYCNKLIYCEEGECKKSKWHGRLCFRLRRADCKVWTYYTNSRSSSLVLTNVQYRPTVTVKSPACQWRRQGGGQPGHVPKYSSGRAPAVKPCALVVELQWRWPFKRISWLRARHYFEDVNYDVISITLNIVFSWIWPIYTIYV